MAALGDIWSQTAWPAGWHVRHVAETGSTNTDLLAALDAGTAADRTVLATDHQTAGRGRLDRRWDAPPGSNLLVSIAFAPVPAVPAELTHRVGLAAVAAVRNVSPNRRVGLKWPNDVMLDERKLAGVLAQRSSVVDAAVVGIGVNVGWAPDGAARLGADVTPAGLLCAMLDELDRSSADVAAAYRRELLTVGQDVRVELPSGELLGVAVDVDDAGRLAVRDEQGVLHRVDVGDVVHVRQR